MCVCGFQLAARLLGDIARPHWQSQDAVHVLAQYREQLSCRVQCMVFDGNAGNAASGVSLDPLSLFGSRLNKGVSLDQSGD
jgi:hypothetical protein